METMNLQVNQDNNYAVGRFSHAATIQAVGNGDSVIAFYTGPQECHNKQHVVILYNEEGRVEPDICHLEDLTGNPILFYDKDDKLQIIYSKFEEFPARRAHWWQWCSTWQAEIYFKSGKVYTKEPKQIFVEEPVIQNLRTDMEIILNRNPRAGEDYTLPKGLGYVPRCKVLRTNEGFFLPLYREHAPLYHSVILFSEDGHNWEYRGRIGVGEDKCGIQPTLWEEGGKLHCLMRNFGRIARVPNYQPKALYSVSRDGGARWSPLEHSESYYNANNSIAVLNRDGKAPFVVWNDSQNGRDHLALGCMGRKFIDLDVRYGSYPDITADDETLQIVYTAEANPYRNPDVRTIIKHKTFSLKALERAALGVDQTLR